MKVTFVDLQAQYNALKTEIDANIKQVLDHGQYIMGPEVGELEDRLADFVGVKHCITVSSGTDALLLALMGLEIGIGDEVITSPFTFVATAEVIAFLGAKPVFVDIDPQTFNIDTKLIEEKISARTRDIIPVSLYGLPADMDTINDIAKRHDIPVIEDAAQSFGADYKGKKSCGLSTVGCTSFFPSKPLGCYGDGGAMFTNDDDLAKRFRNLRIHGQPSRYYHTEIGIAGRMDTLQSAVVLAKLKTFPQELVSRKKIARRYVSELTNSVSPELDGRAPAFTVPKAAQQPGSVFAQFTIQSEERDALKEHLGAHSIPTAIHYPVPLNEQPAYEKFCCIDCTPNARAAAQTVLSLPLSPYMLDDHQSQVITALKAFSHRD